MNLLIILRKCAEFSNFFFSFDRLLSMPTCFNVIGNVLQEF